MTRFSNGGPLCFAYVGRLVSLKGLPLILEAAKKLKIEGYNFRVKFVGDGPERRELESLAEKFGLLKYVQFTGFITGPAFQIAMKDVAAVLMPSVWEETAGLAAIEQMMRGKLVIAFSIMHVSRTKRIWKIWSPRLATLGDRSRSMKAIIAYIATLALEPLDCYCVTSSSFTPPVLLRVRISTQ